MFTAILRRQVRSHKLSRNGGAYLRITMKRCTQADISLLCELSRATFTDAFAAKNDPDELTEFLAGRYSEDKLMSEMADDGSSFYFLYCGDFPAGYIKINLVPSQSDINDPDSLEIERIYVLRNFQGRGIGGHAIAAAADMARTFGKKYIWLGVWENNERAISFYKKQGFYRIGAHSFFIGRNEQTDYIMRRDL